MFFGPVGGQLKPIFRYSWACAQRQCSSRRYPGARGARANSRPSCWPRTHMRHRRVPNCAPWRRFGAAPRTAHSAARTRPQCPSCRWNIARFAEPLRGAPQLEAGSRASSTPSRRRSVPAPVGWPEAACGRQRWPAVVSGGQGWSAVVNDGWRCPAAAGRLSMRPL